MRKKEKKTTNNNLLGKCKLCGEAKQLRDSHIIPEFFYKPIYDEKHRLNVVTTINNYRKFEQKGLREYLLCDECEQYFNELETYTANLFNRDNKISAKYEGDNVIFSNVNYNKFKLFQLSLLWRAGISTLEFFSGVNLGPHEAKIKSLLIEKSPGKSTDYGCVMVFQFSSEKELLDSIVVKPHSYRSFGHRSFIFVLGAAMWIYFVSSHTNTFEYRDYFLKEDGTLKVKRKADDYMLKSIANKLEKAGKLPI